jgi:hypothetical protein
VATNPQTSVASRNLALDAAFDVLNSGYLKIYDGTQPATVATAITTQNLLSTHTLSATAFAAASSGSKVANAIGSAVASVGGGGVTTPTWYSLTKSDGTRVHENNIGASGSLVFSNGVTQIVNGATVTISSLTVTQP